MPSLSCVLFRALAMTVLVAGCSGAHGERIDAECIAELGCPDGEQCVAGRCVRSESASVTVTGEVFGAPTGVRVEAPRGVIERCAPGAEQDLVCSVEAGGRLVLIAPEVPGFRFAGWRGAPACTGKERELALQAVTGDLVCTAEYVARFQVRGESEGASAPIAAQAEQPGVCAAERCEVDRGASVTLIAGSAPGVHLQRWSGAGCEAAGGAAALVRDVQADVTCRAHYVAGVAVSGTVVNAQAEVVASSSSPGAACAAGRCALDAGGQATLTAPALPGRVFLGWSGDPGCAGGDNQLVLAPVTNSTHCIATYLARHAVEAEAAPADGGSVALASASPGARCEAQRCELDAGSTVTLEARANAGFRFVGWGGAPACTGAAALLELGPVGTDVHCTATFAPQIQIAGDVLPAATGAVLAGSEAPGATCGQGSCTVDIGSDVLLAASPADGYRFVRWSGCGALDDPRLAQNPLSVVAPSASQRCTATFEPIVYAVQARAEPGGSVMALVAGAPCADARCLVNAGGSVTLTASPATGYTFSGWSGCPAGAAELTLPDVRADQICVAQFARVRIALTGSSLPAGLASVQASSPSPAASCAGSGCTVDYGESVRLEVVEVAAGFRFARWIGCQGGEASGRSITVANLTRDQNCQALLVQQRMVTGVAVPTQGGTVSCAEGCQLNDGGRIELTALPRDGWTFSGWQGCAQSADAVLVLTAVTADRVCEAVFEPTPMLF